MRKILVLSLALVVVLGIIVGTSASAAPRSSAGANPSNAKPAWTKANAFWRTREWAEYDEKYPSYEPYECKGPYENGHGVTQWACKGDYGLNKLGNTKWQVNIDAYGEQTWWHAE